KELVGDAPAQEIVAIDQVLVRFLRSVFRKVGTGPAALRGFPEAARILNHTVERHQCRYNELPHDHLLMSAALDRLVGFVSAIYRRPRYAVKLLQLDPLKIARCFLANCAKVVAGTP